MRRLLTIASLLLLSACVTKHESVPPDYAGPVAQVADSGRSEGGSKAQLFVLAEIDGKTVDNAMLATRKASYGRGRTLITVFPKRPVPAAPMKVKLIGTHQTAAPIHELASRAAGTFYSVEGVVDFAPEAGKNYVVTGELNKAKSSVWIEEAQTKQVMTRKIESDTSP